MVLADWYWETTQSGKKRNDITKYKKFASQLRWLLGNGFTESGIKRTVLMMKRSGLVPDSPMSVRWRVNDSEQSWYDYASANTPPPIWDEMAYRYWEAGMLPVPKRGG